MDKQTFTSLRCLRGIAACLVVVFHITVGRRGSGYWETFGQIGVDLFFVISGCVMVLASANRELRSVEFIKARLIRIVPLYWLILLAFLPLAAADPRRQGWPALSEIVKTFLFIPYTDSKTLEMLPYFSPGWTLTYEMFFYLLFAATLRLRSALAQVLILGALFSFLVTLRSFLDEPGAIMFRFTSPLFFEFLAGMILATNVRRLQQLPAWAGAVLFSFVLGFIWMESIAGENQLPRYLSLGIPATGLVAAGLIAENAVKRWRKLGPLELLGDASYSLYLTHLPVVMIAHGILGKGLLRPGPAVLVMTCCMMVGVLIHFAIERPLLSAVRRATGHGARAKQSLQVGHSAD